MVLEKILQNPLTLYKDSQPFIMKETSPEYSLEGLMQKLKLQYFGHLMRRTDSMERPCMTTLWKPISIVFKPVIFCYSNPEGLRQHPNNL